MEDSETPFDHRRHHGVCPTSEHKKIPYPLRGTLSHRVRKIRVRPFLKVVARRRILVSSALFLLAHRSVNCGWKCGVSITLYGGVCGMVGGGDKKGRGYWKDYVFRYILWYGKGSGTDGLMSNQTVLWFVKWHRTYTGQSRDGLCMIDSQEVLWLSQQEVRILSCDGDLALH